MAHFIFISGSEGELGHWEACLQILGTQDHQGTAFGWSCLPWKHGLAGVLTFLQEQVHRVEAPILVGHSAGGLLIPRLHHGATAEIYLAALAPQPGLSFAEQMFESPTEVFDPTWLAQAYPPHTAEAAILHTLYEAPFTHYIKRPRLYIPCLEDREIRPEWQQWVAKEIMQAEGRALHAGHYAHLTHPGEVSSAFAHFAEHLPRAGTPLKAL